MSDKNSYDVDVAVSEYFKETLKPNGFCNSQGINIMSIDAWDGMSSEQRTRFSEVVKKNGQVPVRTSRLSVVVERRHVV